METLLPEPCPVCGERIVYSGRGRRPSYHRSCRRVQKTDDMREYRARDAAPPVALPAHVHEILARRRARPRVAVRRAVDDWTPDVDEVAAEAHGEGIAVFSLAASSFVPDGWAERTASRREDDPAARWLAAHHPEALHDFPADY